MVENSLYGSGEGFGRVTGRCYSTSIVLMDFCPAVRWQGAKSAHSPSYVSDERRRQRTAGRKSSGQYLRETV